MTNYELAEKDYMLGMKYKDIATKYGVTIATVKKWKTRYKWERPSKKTPSTKKCRQEKKVDNKKSGHGLPAVVSDEPDGLTEKQRLFCLYYIKNFNATQAALKAGYSPNTASVIGWENLTKPLIRAEVERLKAIKRQSIMINEDDIIERYMRIAFADMTDFTEFGLVEVPEVDGAGQILLNPDGTVRTRKYNYMNFKSSDQVDGGLICEISHGKNGMKVKLEDRMKALNWLADFFGANPMHKHKIEYDNAVLALRERELKLKEW